MDMSIERKVRALAGTIILISLLLSLWSPWWLFLTAFVGLNLLQSAFTGFCPAENVFRKLERHHGPTQRTANP
jgi:hypothetical protein